MLNIILILNIIFLINVKISVASLVGRCNQCFASNKVACVDETHFATCFQGVPTAIVTKCPSNRFCTDDVFICHSSAEGYSPVCYYDGHCGDCEITNGIFSCLDETTYGYCFSGKTPLEGTSRSCPKGYVCNYNFKEVCVSENTHKPSCTSKITNPTTTTPTITISTESTTTALSTTTGVTTETTTAEVTTESTISTTEKTTSIITTTLKPRDADTICGGIGKTGYFKSDDPTCREYVFCYLLSGQYLGWFYYCDGYFNAATQKCQKSRPADCIPY